MTEDVTVGSVLQSALMALDVELTNKGMISPDRLEALVKAVGVLRNIDGSDKPRYF